MLGISLDLNKEQWKDAIKRHADWGKCATSMDLTPKLLNNIRSGKYRPTYSCQQTERFWQRTSKAKS